MVASFFIISNSVHKEYLELLRVQKNYLSLHEFRSPTLATFTIRDYTGTSSM